MPIAIIAGRYALVLAGILRCTCSRAYRRTFYSGEYWKMESTTKLYWSGLKARQ